MILLIPDMATMEVVVMEEMGVTIIAMVMEAADMVSE